jgi:hypothetical protein
VTRLAEFSTIGRLKKIFLKRLFFIKYTQWQCILSFGNSTAMCKYLKTLHGIRTEDLLFWRRTRWPLCHATRAFGRLFSWAVFWKFQKWPKNLGYLFPRQKVYISFDKKAVWLWFGRTFHKLIWSPWKPRLFRFSSYVLVSEEWRTGLPDFSWSKIPKRGNIYQITTK